ncbi:ketoacyl-ACP synthase III [Lachnospiraceae bacterium OttesenSCG-928-J05]|nr:ketoacyl-ACP synthase III [Lachnospiraceae bacterium OttesenSCG-928-J05]
MTGKIIGTGSYAPAYIMDNNELATYVETSDEWIRERTGVARRHIAGEETVSSMAAAAAKAALADAKVEAAEIELIILATNSPDALIPACSCLVQREIGAVNAVCFDITAACTGFVLAYNTAQAYIASGLYKKILIIGSETLSNIIDWSDRGSCILFGDGAGAAVVGASEGTYYTPVAHTDGSKAEALTLTNRFVGNSITKKQETTYTNPEFFMQMDGQAVFKFAVSKVTEVIGEVLEKNNRRPEEIDYFILHQANKRIVEAISRRMKQPLEKYPMNLMDYGNTSSASIPIILSELDRDGTLKTGDVIVIAGFGGGLTWGASIIEW